MRYTIKILVMIFHTLLCSLAGLLLSASDVLPTISPMASYADEDGNTQEETAISEGAPLTVTFTSGAADTDGWTNNNEWRFNLAGSRDGA